MLRGQDTRLWSRMQGAWAVWPQADSVTSVLWPEVTQLVLGDDPRDGKQLARGPVAHAKAPRQDRPGKFRDRTGTWMRGGQREGGT